MAIFIAFDTLDTSLYMEYDRNNRAAPLSLIKGNFAVRAKVYSHYSNKMIPATITPPWYPVLYKIVSDGYTPKFEKVWELPPSTALSLSFTLPTTDFPDGHYYLGSSERNTLIVPLMIKNGVNLIPAPEYIAICPAYMVREFPNPMGTNPGLTEPAIIRWEGVRPARTASVPVLQPVKPTRRLKLTELWADTLCLATQQKEFVRYPCSTPWGGVTENHQMRYQERNFDDVNPLQASLLSPTAFNNDQFRYSPTERMDGHPADAGVGVVNTAFQDAATGLYFALDPMGSLFGVDLGARKLKTVYGWVRKPGTLHPRNIDKCATVEERLAFLLEGYDRIGSGPDIWRAWHMCPSGTDSNIIYVANTGANTIVEVDIATGLGRTIAGTENVAGHQDGMNALFDQPRGVTHLTTGPYAGHLFICDEHNSAFRLLNLATGEVTTIAKAQRVPLNPGIELGTRNPLDTTSSTGAVTLGLRTIWGMPGPRGSVQSLSDCQFVHPCQVAQFSDGRLGIVHHDAYQISIVDLVAQTITYFRDIQVGYIRAEVLPLMWPTISIDKTGAFGAVDDVFVSAWQYTTLDRFALDGTAHPLSPDGYLTQGGPAELTRGFAYPRSWMVGVDGSCLYNGDDGNGLHLIRAKMAADPLFNSTRYAAGKAVYRAEVQRADGSWRPSMMLSHGPNLQNYWGGQKCGADFAGMGQVEFNLYWLQKGVTDLDETQLKDFRYFVMWSSPEGIQKLREGVVV